MGAVRVGVVGAGIAGLGAARSLQAGGHEVVVFEAASVPGGRIATRSVGGYVFDTGATSVSPNHSALARPMLDELDTSELVEISLPVGTHTADRVGPGDPSRSSRRFTYRPGMAHLPWLMSAGLNVRYGQRLEAIEERAGQYLLKEEPFDSVVVTLPFPQAVDLAASVRPRLSVGRASHRACVSVLLGFDQPLEASYFASVDPDQRLPLVWLSLESVKSPGRAPKGKTAMVAQMGPTYSHYAFDHADERIVQDAVVDVTRLYGKRFAAPEVAEVIRWKFSQPEVTVSFEAVNPEGTRVLIAGDGVAQGRVEHAYESGLRAAREVSALR